MKSLSIEKMENLEGGGATCYGVGLLTGLILGSIGVNPIGSLMDLHDLGPAISYCWWN